MISDYVDVVSIGNAIVDIVNPIDFNFLKVNKLVPGSMNLVDENKSKNLLSQINPNKEIISGGSAANTAVGISSFGGKAAFIVKVKNDQYGNLFKKELDYMNVFFDTEFTSDGPATATSIISVTPDGERTMCTYLGACLGLDENDIDEKILAKSKICYLEGYLWDPPKAKKAFIKAINICKTNGNQTAFSLSDSFCVNRFKREFEELVCNDIDILFSNEDEIKALYNSDNLENSIKLARENCEIVIITKGSEGSIIVSKNDSYEINAIDVEKVIDKNGAGDAFAAGFLYGISNGYKIDKCGELGNIAATEMITHYGARPERKFSKLLIDYKIK